DPEGLGIEPRQRALPRAARPGQHGPEAGLHRDVEVHEVVGIEDVAALFHDLGELLDELALRELDPIARAVEEDREAQGRGSRRPARPAPETEAAEDGHLREDAVAELLGALAV